MAILPQGFQQSKLRRIGANFAIFCLALFGSSVAGLHSRTFHACESGFISIEVMNTAEPNVRTAASPSGGDLYQYP
jgi:hypothetical protein